MKRLTILIASFAATACPGQSQETGATETTDPPTSTTTAETSDDSTTTTSTTAPTTGPTTSTATSEDTTSTATSEDTTSTATTDDTASTATSDDTTSTTTDTTTDGTCGLPPLPEEVIQTLGFNVFGSNFETQPGTVVPTDVGAIECCYFKQPVEACVVYSVEPAEGATISADGMLTIAADAVPGTKYTVTADVEDGRKVLTTEVYVYTLESNPLVGVWHEVAQIPCNNGPEVAPEKPIGELWFRAWGEVNVTWVPFEIYVDYWSDYTYDLDTGDLEIVPEAGNYLPADVEGVGTFTVEGNQLVLQDMWLGSPQDAMKPANCGHRFER
ncbi:hypothetical protein [Nannocystis radixulma]|uniref:Uncharacterized protein n=1 Tax=Nannocystis radixulma TaxID=2995305 RepID=A0ABT5AXI3_9BACT|nr:hypothetical protein [Nannocystis radixulma]MDC0666555.1 hypothetical protein [Nannocystis radixulma]